MSIAMDSETGFNLQFISTGDVCVIVCLCIVLCILAALLLDKWPGIIYAVKCLSAGNYK